MTKYIVVFGGVMSGVGKGVATASIAKIMQQYGFSVTAIKIDPYINCDAGTLRPTEHGEVWVTADGGEIDQDLGNYERFLSIPIPKTNNITTGQIYRSIIEKERRGDFLGQTVQFIPHVPDEIKSRIRHASAGYDICMVEVGGTVGDYENIPFLFALKSLERELGKDDFVYVLLTYLPVLGSVGEMKTKPTQTAIKLLSESGIIPDIILCRAPVPVDAVRRRKIELYANINADNVISAPDIKTIYRVPLNFENENLGKRLLKFLNLEEKKQPDWFLWETLVKNIESPRKIFNIGMVGKYVNIGDFQLSDSYISINEALKHAGANLGVGVNIKWIDSSIVENSPDVLNEIDGIIVPGGFGSAGVEGKIRAIQYARENKKPYLGLCFGMQLAVVEFARNVCGMADANTSEVNEKTNYPVVAILPEQKSVDVKGGTMRLGEYSAVLKQGSLVSGLYNSSCAKERHRHRFEVNPEFVPVLVEQGLVFSGSHTRADGTSLMEFLELSNHPFFVATQAHPEFTSRLDSPNPLFLGFLKAIQGLLDSAK